MDIILVGEGSGKSRTLSLKTLSLLAILFLVILPVALGGVGYLAMQELNTQGLMDFNATKVWQQDLVQQRKQLQSIRKQTTQELDALTLKLGKMQAQLLRLDVLGERLVDTASLDADEFNFSAAPALGGPANDRLEQAYQAVEINDALNQLAQRIDSREQQLEVLDDLMSAEQFKANTFVAGRPIKKGWMSSRYGKRTDPFDGHIAWHAGLDFAGKSGSDIIAVAAGVVTWSGARYGYGNLVEINHGNGYKTRYAHCKETKVKVGDVVRKNDVVALMGSTGRSTGPHVHFEVYKNGRTVDPILYINRASR